MRWPSGPLLQALARGALQLYPRRWRDRYQAEVEGLLEEHVVSVATVLNLSQAAIGERIRSMSGWSRLALVPFLLTMPLFYAAFDIFHDVFDGPTSPLGPNGSLSNTPLPALAPGTS